MKSLFIEIYGFYVFILASAMTASQKVSSKGSIKIIIKQTKNCINTRQEENKYFCFFLLSFFSLELLMKKYEIYKYLIY